MLKSNEGQLNEINKVIYLCSKNVDFVLKKITNGFLKCVILFKVWQQVFKLRHASLIELYCVKWISELLDYLYGMIFLKAKNLKFLLYLGNYKFFFLLTHRQYSEIPSSILNQITKK